MSANSDRSEGPDKTSANTQAQNQDQDADKARAVVYKIGSRGFDQQSDRPPQDHVDPTGDTEGLAKSGPSAETDAAPTDQDAAIQLPPLLRPGPALGPPVETRRIGQLELGGLVLAALIAAPVVLLAFAEFPLPWFGSSPGSSATLGSSTADPPKQANTADATLRRPPAEDFRLVQLPAVTGGPNDVLSLRMPTRDHDNSVTIVLDGLADGTTLSVGGALGASRWWLPIEDMERAQLRPPKDFVGVMSITAEFQRADGTVADRQSLQLEWTRASSTVPETFARDLSPGEIQFLIDRGQQFIATRDISSARLVLNRAAEAGNARAALMLGTTYDPVELAKLGAPRVFADIAIARTWYEKAKEFGSPEAPQRLKVLASGEH